MRAILRIEVMAEGTIYLEEAPEDSRIKRDIKSVPEIEFIGCGILHDTYSDGSPYTVTYYDVEIKYEEVEVREAVADKVLKALADSGQMENIDTEWRSIC